MNDYIDEAAIEEYLLEYNGLEFAIERLVERRYTIDQILRNEHNFAIDKDRL